MDEEDKVKRLPVRFKAPPGEEGRALKVVDSNGCNHAYYFVQSRIVNVTYLIRSGETEIECSNCGTRLEPMWVLRQLANKEGQWHRSREHYNNEMKRLGERSRTQCDHCGKMTRISRAKPKKSAG